jgi:hypothetical protein
MPRKLSGAGKSARVACALAATVRTNKNAIKAIALNFIFILSLLLRRLTDKVRRIINAPAALVLDDTWVWAKWPRPG